MTIESTNDQEFLNFAGRELSFKLAKKDFVEKDKEFFLSLETSRLNNDPIVVFLDVRDGNYVSQTDQDSDNSFHYSFLGTLKRFEGNFYLESVIPLPVFVMCMGFVTSDSVDEVDYQLSLSFEDIIYFLEKMFPDNVFFGSRQILDSGGYYNEGLRGLPQATRSALGIIREKGMVVLDDSQLIEELLKDESSKLLGVK